MKETRLTLLPDERFAGFQHALDERLAAVGKSIDAHNFTSLLDATMRRVIHQSFKDAHSDEGTVWLVDHDTKTLDAAYNTGPSAAKMVGHVKHPLGAGLISMVFANERPFLENDVAKNAKQDKSLDAFLGLKTHAIIAVPFNYLDACRGVISCVQLTGAGAANTDRSFNEEDKTVVYHAAATLGRLIDHRVLRVIVGRV